MNDEKFAVGKPYRLFSLDVLRGMDMLLIVAVGRLLRSADAVWGLPPQLMAQVRHNWGGFTFWDMIMPLFIFMCGAAVPFGLGKRMKDGRPTIEYWKHVAGRVVLLWVLGMVSQGHLLTLDPMMVSPYNNTLQAIAMGYLVAASAMCVPSKWFRRLLPVGLALLYAVLLSFFGDYSKDGNFAMRVELKALSWLVPDGSEAYNLYGYTWFLTSLMFGAMTMTGFNATELLRSALSPWRKCGWLALGGVALCVFGYGIAPVVPLIKPIYSLSFTAASMGWSCIALAALYALTDILGCRRGCGLFVLYGQFALWAYMAGVFAPAFNSLSEVLLGGLAHWIGEKPMPFVYAVSYVCLVTCMLLVRRRLSASRLSAR